MIQTTRWSPDTCKCVYEYTWNDAVPDDQRVHSFAKKIQSCPAHQGLDAKKAYDAVLKENQTKNIVLENIKTHAPSLTKKITQSDGTEDVAFDPAKHPKYSFGPANKDGVRELIVEAPALKGKERTAVLANITKLSADISLA